MVEPDRTIHIELGTKIKTVVKQVVPDTTAQIFWLKNRKPEQWRDKRDVSVDGKIDAGTEKLDLILKQLKED